MGFQFVLILGLLGMYFDAGVVFVMKSSLLFKLAMAMLWQLVTMMQVKEHKQEAQCAQNRGRIRDSNGGC